MNRIGEFGLLLILFFSNFVSATIVTPKHPHEGVLDTDNNKFIDPKVDYEKFIGRVSDKDDKGRVLKIHVENNNTKFLKSGDVVFFKVNNMDQGRFCKAFVRSVEDFYFSIFVQQFKPCWPEDKYFPRGMQLNFEAKIMSQRVFEASKFRELLLLRKDGFLKQLSQVNNFLWSFEQQKVKTAASYDQQINELKQAKRKAMNNLLRLRQENIILQTDLTKKLDSLDESLEHYTVERQEHLLDRWDLDHDSGLPMGQRPQDFKKQ